MEELFKILTLILISSVKFAFGPSFVYLNEAYDFTWFETNLYAITGGMIGVVVFMFFSDWIFSLWEKARHSYYHRKQRRQNLFSEPVADTTQAVEIHYRYIENPVPKKKVFTARNRRVVRIWRRYGLLGLAALTPVIFSIPIGTFFIARLEKNKKKILLYMFVSITCWSVILTSIFHLLHIRTIPEIIK